MKVLLVHSAYQQFGGEDSVVRAETELLKQHGDEVYLYSRHNDEIKQFGLIDKALFFPQSIYSWKTSGELEDVVRRVKPDVAFIHNVYPLISPAAYHKLHQLGVPALQVLHNFRPFCPNGFFYTQGQICEACRGGNYLNAISKRCYKDSRLLNRPMRLTARPVGDTNFLQVFQVHSYLKGELHEVYYWCDICAIKRFEKRQCECCGGPMELREEKVKK